MTDLPSVNHERPGELVGLRKRREVRRGTDQAAGHLAKLHARVSAARQVKNRVEIHPRPAVSLVGGARGQRDGLSQTVLLLYSDPVDVGVNASGHEGRVDGD